MSKRHANIPSFPFLKDLNIDLEARQKLSINLARIYSGSSDIIETPMCREHSAIKVLSKWDKVFQDNISSMNDVLLKLEELQKSKIGPRSISKPWKERREGTYAYFEGNKVNYDLLDATPEATRDKGILRPISVDNATKLMKNSTNSGLPFYTRKGLVKDRVLARFEHFLKRMDPCVLFTRTQEQGKTRDVWGYPIADSINEMRYYSPLLAYQRKLKWRSSLNGPEYVNMRLTHIIDEARRLGLELVSIDFSSYDRSVKLKFQQKISEYYKYLFQVNYSMDIDKMTIRKGTIELVTPDGILKGNHGLPSGATLTNEDGSVGQFIISRKSNCTVDGLFDIQGDDGVYAIASDKVKSFMNCFKKYGFDVNEDKSYRSSDYLVYLQNLYHIDYRRNGVITGIYPIYRALNRLLYQERWSNFEEFGIKGIDYYSIRAICILENCKYHPLFEELVKFVIKYDKYSLDYSNEGLSQYVKMISQTSGIEGILINQYGDNIKGIGNFETVKLINKLK